MSRLTFILNNSSTVKVRLLERQRVLFHFANKRLSNQLQMVIDQNHVKTLHNTRKTFVWDQERSADKYTEEDVSIKA